MIFLPNQLELQTQFSGFLFETGLSSVSIKNYLSDIRHFFAFCSSVSIYQDTPTVQEIFQNITKYLNLYLADQQKSYTPQNTINRRSASIRRFSTFLASKYGLSSNPNDALIGANHPNNGEHSSNSRDDNSLPTTKKILEHFKNFLLKEKKSYSTVKNYISDLNHFFAWSANETPFLDQNLENILSESHLNAYVSYLKLSHTSTSVINRRQSSVKQFSRYAYLQKYIPSNPFEYKANAPRLLPLSWLERFSSSKNKGAKNGSGNHLAIWYQKYNSLPFTPYLHLAILVLATSAMVIFGYNQIIKQAKSSSAALPTIPKRQLSFQGRLTDSSGTPITTPVDVTFSLFNQLTGGSQLYTTSTCSVDPDQNGIFNSLIGNGTCGVEIDSTVFTNNRDVFLQISIGEETLTPRQQIATVGYALNSETLQGYPASGSATTNTVPIVDNNGDINIAASSPTINSTSGTFTINGQALSLTTADSSGGNIVLQPDAIGGGQVQVLGSTTNTDTLYVQNANLTSGNLIAGYVGNDTATGRLLSLTSGSSETDRFYVAASGQTMVNTVASLANAGLVLNQNGTGDIFTASQGGTVKFTIGNTGNISATGTLTGLTGLTVASGTVSLPNNEINNAEISELDWTKLQNYPSACGAGEVVQAVGDTLTCVSVTSLSGNLWQRTDGSLAPLNITDSLNLGNTATTSALVHLAGTTGEDSWINTGTGKLGIGTTTPAEKLDVNGGIKLAMTTNTNAGTLRYTTGNNLEIYDGTYWAVLNTGKDTKEITGFVDRTTTSLSFTNTSPDRTFTITGTDFPVYIKSEILTKNTESIQIADTVGLHFIYYDSSGTLTESVNNWDLSTTIPIATVYWNGATGLIGDERHGITMDYATHEYLHKTVGTRYDTGLGGSFTNSTFSVDPGSIYDEDLKITITPAKTTTRVFYRIPAASSFTYTSPQAAYYTASTGVLDYDNAGTLTAVPTNNYVAYWIFATNDPTTPIYSLMGQGIDINLTNARNNNNYQSLSLPSLPFAEMKILYRVLVRNLGGTATYIETQDLRNISNLPSGTFLATAHGTLTGLLNDDHTQYALLAGRTLGQTLIGGSAANETLTLQGNAAATGNTATSANIIFNTGDSGGTTAMTILNNGNVGVGITNPSAVFQVNGSLTSAGGNISFNNDSNFTANINTGSSTGAVTIGGNSNTVAINSSNWDVSTSGAASGLTGIASSGDIDLSSLSAGGMVKAAVTTGRLSIASSGTDYELPLTFSNGLTRTVNAVALGGTLTGTTDIPLGGFNLTFSGEGKLGIGLTDPTAKLQLSGAVTGKALSIFDEIGDQAIFTASNSGTTRYTLNNDGSIVQTPVSTTGNAQTVNLNSLTSGTGLFLTSSSGDFSSGKFFSVDHTATTTGTNENEGNLLALNRNLTYSPTISAIAKDNTSSSKTTGSSLTYSHTVNAVSNRVLIVTVGSYNNKTVSGVTYNGVSMSLAGSSYSNSNTWRSYLYYLVNPSSGAHDVVVSLSGSADVLSSATTWYNVDQTNPISASVSNNGSLSGSTSVNVSSSADEVVIDSVSGYAGTLTIGAGQSSVYSDSQGAMNTKHGASYETGAATTTMSWSGMVGYANNVAVALKPVSSGLNYLISGAVASISSTCTVTSGVCSDTSNLLYASQNFTTATGSVVKINNLGLGTGLEIISNSGGQAAVSISNTGDGDILTASSSATTVMTLGKTGNLSLTNSGSSNIIFNLSSTGDMVIQDNSSPFATFTDTGTFILDSLTLDGTDITSSGALGLSSAAGSDITLTSRGNSFTLPTTAGSDGYLLSTNGSGTLSWIDPTIHNNLNVQGYATISASLAVGYTNAPEGPGHGIFAGLVGIGLTNPAYSLDVVGDINITGALRDNTDAGDAGQILSSTGTGVEWIDPPAGTTNYWQLNDGAVTPANITNSLNLGDVATASATVHLAGTSAENSFINTGNFGIGDTTPVALFTVGSADLFQVNSSGIIAAIDGVAHTIDDVSGNLTFTSAGSSVMIADDLGVNGATSADITSTTTTATVFDTTVTSLSMAGEATTLNMAAGGALTRAINIGTGTGIDTIHIGDGATGADVITIGSTNAGNVSVKSNAVLNLTGGANSVIDFPNFDVATTGNITTAGDIDLNGGDLLSTGDITINPTGGDVFLGASVNLGITAATNLIFGTTTSLGETTAANDSGAYLVGVYDEFDYSNGANVQAVLNDLDAQLALSVNYWQLNDGTVTPKNITNSLNLGDTATASATVHLAGTSAENSFINTGYFGIGTTTPTAMLTIKGSNTNSLFSSELLTTAADQDFSSDSGNWGTGATWVIGSDVATHTASATNFIHTLAATAGKTYTIEADITTTTPGTIQPKMGGVLGQKVGQSVGSLADTDWTITATGTESFRFVPNANWEGTIDNVSVMEVTASYPQIVLNNSDNSTGLEIRSGIGSNEKNTFIGINAGRFMGTGGSLNVALGNNSLASSTYSDGNVALGTNTLFSNTFGGYNVALGTNALYRNTMGQSNLAIGADSLVYNVTGSGNIAVGEDSLGSNTTGENNIALGLAAGYSLLTGSNNLLLGYQAGDILTSGSSNIIIGNDIDLPSASSVNMLDIGNLIYATGLTSASTEISSGNVGIGTTTPSARLDIAGDLNVQGYATMSGSLAVGYTNAPEGPGHAIFAGLVGVGKTNPATALDVVGVGTFSTGLTLSSGALNLTSTSGAISATALGASTISTTSNNLTLSTVTSGTLALTSAGALNLSAGSASTWTLASAVNALNIDSNTLTIDSQNNRIGIGITNPTAALEIAGDILPNDTTYYLGSATLPWLGAYLASIYDTAGVETISLSNHYLANGNWYVQSGGLKINTDSVFTATELANNIKLYVNGNATISGTFKTGADIIVNEGNGKISVGTIDPPYTINGNKYATYVASMIGVKEEIVGNITTTDENYIEGLGYRSLIDLDQQPIGSDIWLFSQATNIRSHINSLSVLLTPKGQANAWYEIDKENNILAIYSSTPTNITYRLTAPRYDADNWKNTRDNPNEPIGHVINDPYIYENQNSIFDNPVTSPELIAKIDGTYSLKINNVENKVVSSFMKSIIANLKAGAAVVSNLVAENLTVTTKLISPIADIDQLKVIDATISGTLYADNIKGQTIDNLHSQINLLDEKYSTASSILAELQARYSTYSSLQTDSNATSLFSDPLSLSPLATASATLPQDLILNTLFVNSDTFTGSLSSFDTDLFIQPLADKPIHLLANLMTLYPDGKVLINGDVLVTGTLIAQGIDTQIASVSGTLAVGSSTIASDSARFATLSTDGLIIASGNDSQSTISGQIGSNATIGTANILSGTNEVSIQNTKITPTTLIYITPTSDTQGRVLYVKSKTANVGFTVGLTGDTNTPNTSFNFWLVETK